MKNWNSLGSQSIFVRKFCQMLYFFIQFDTLNESLYYLFFLLLQIFKVTKKPALLYKKNPIFDELLTVLLLLMLPFSEAAVCRCPTKQMFLKILQKHKKDLCRSLCFNRATRLQKETPYRCFSANFVKILRTPILQNASELLLLRFEEVIIKIDVKKFYVRKYIFKYNKYIYTTTHRLLKSHRSKYIYNI